MKNPIAVALGYVLRDIRNENSIPVDNLVNDIDINVGYYRLLESGTNTIHISKTIDVVNTFNQYGVGISYDGFYKLLMGVYFTQPLVKLSEDNDPAFERKKNKLLINLEDYDNKLFKIVKKFDQLNLFNETKLNSKGVVEILNKYKVTDDVLEFLCDYSEFGEDLNKIQNEYLNSFFNDVPTIYLKLIYDVKSNIKSMPTNIGVSNLWEWENANKKSFIELTAFVEDSTSITSLENLRRYTYSYLWLESFDNVFLFYLDDKKESDVLKDFRKNLLKVVNRMDNDKYKKEFDSVFEKIKVKQISKSEITIPKGNIFLEKRGIEYKPNAAWVFSMESKINVGFLAEINPKNDLLSNGESLDIQTTDNLMKQFQKLKNTYGL